MTIENYRYKTSPLFLRNQFMGQGKWDIPSIPTFKPQANELNDCA